MKFSPTVTNAPSTTSMARKASNKAEWVEVGVCLGSSKGREVGGGVGGLETAETQEPGRFSGRGCCGRERIDVEERGNAYTMDGLGSFSVVFV